MNALTGDHAVGAVVNVPFVDEAGLREESMVPFMVRDEHLTLWGTLNRVSCFLEGPPGSGKSTAVWFWLLRRVQSTGLSAVWLHFSKLGAHFSLRITRGTDGQLSFYRILEVEPFTSNDYISSQADICVVDGVTNSNVHAAGKSWRVFGLDARLYRNYRMIWVSSQQVVVGVEHLTQLNMERRTYFSWEEADIRRYASTFSPTRQAEFKDDVVAGMSSSIRLEQNEAITFEQALNIKIHFCGCSARWMFGTTMKKALEDIHTHIAAIDNAQMIQSGLSGSRSEFAVNHIIAMSEVLDQDVVGVFKIASSYIMEKLSDKVGLAAIRVMYSSSWVQNNPSVHGFVFEWDILTRLGKFKKLDITDIGGNTATWTIQKNVRLAELARNGMTADCMLVCPEKWNHPEYDGLYVYRDKEDLHLVAWNASEATTHTGNVSGLVVMLEALSQRVENPINFASIRFLFLVPHEGLHQFRMPNDSYSLLARQQLAAWSFPGFEVWGTPPSTLEH